MGGGYDSPLWHAVDGVGKRLEAGRIGGGGGPVERVDYYVYFGGGCVEGYEGVTPLGVGEGCGEG